MRWMFGLLLILLCWLSRAAAVSVVVSNGYEFHSSLTSTQVTWVLLADNITFSIETCPFPAADDPESATTIGRNVTIMSLSPAALAAAAAAGAPVEPAAIKTPQVAAALAGGPFVINCNHLDGRFQLRAKTTLEYNSVILVDCRTLSTAGFITKRKGSTLILNNTVENQGGVCLPLPTAQGIANSMPRQPGLAAPAGSPSAQQYTAYAPTGSDWCASASTGGRSINPPLPRNLVPTVLANSTDNALCQQPALLLADTAWLETPTPVNATKGLAQPEQEQFTMLATQSALLCPSPVSQDCLRQNGTDACLAAAYRAVNPDADPPCAAVNGCMMQSCLLDPAVNKIVMFSDVELNMTTSPSVMLEDPFVINRNVTILADPRGPRNKFDCNLMADRFQVAAGVTITLQHLSLSRCSIGYEKPLMLFRFDQGARLVMNDTFLLQPDNLCLLVQTQSGDVLHQQRPAEVPGLQRIELGQPQEWCTRSSGTRTAAAETASGGTRWLLQAQGTSWQPGAKATSDTNNSNRNSWVPPSRPNTGWQPNTGSASGANAGWQPGAKSTSDTNSSNSWLPPLPQEYANRTGFGPSWAATLDAPATNRYFVHPTWPNYVLCQQQALLLNDSAYGDRFGWTLPVAITRSESLAMLDQQAAADKAANITAAEDPKKLPDDLIRQLGPGYNGTLLVRYINSTWFCQQPSAECARQPNSTAQKACLLTAYAAINPDVAAAAAAGGSGGNYGLEVVLPAVLGSVGGVVLLVSLVCCLNNYGIWPRRDRRDISLPTAKDYNDPLAHSTPTPQRYRNFGWLLGHPSAPSGAPSDPARRLLGIREFTPAGTSDGTTPHALTDPRSPGGTVSIASSGQRLALVSPDGIQLSMLLGAGSFGRVYSGVWNDLRVAVKIISHSAEDDTRISSELSLSLSFDHPNLVRALHYARLKINPNSPEESLGAPSTAGTGSLFLPEGAVGVFDLPSTWAVIQKQGLAGPPPMIDTETWIVMDLMDRGNLAAAIRQGAFLDTSGEGLIPAALLRRCADIAAGVAYLHSRNVCHGDLKCENILLRSEPQDPDGLMAAVADFGLSRALAFGQSHLSTRRYGTVTHMPPELLVAGKLTPAADVYSFGIMMWEMVTRTPPFAGLHHGEVIHKVVTQDLRPGPWPAEVHEFLPPDYISLAEACWARKSAARPTADEVLQRLLNMLAVVEGKPVEQYA